MKAAFFTLGCKVNQYETEVLMAQFVANGFELVDCSDEADVYVVNSCTVTASGDKKTRQVLRRFKRQNPTAVVALTGCFPQAFPDAAQQLPEADVITGSYNRASLFDAVIQSMTTGQRVVRITPHKPGEQFEKMTVSRFCDRTRAFIKIQDGCDRYCSYCIIPTARGPVRSKPMADLKAELLKIAAAGYREVVLVGINLSCYGRGSDHRLVDAVELACSIDGIERVRLGSLEPELMSDADLARMARQPKLCPQFHLSLQSGCDATLKRMNRHYTTATYQALVEKIRALFTNPSITTDLMVGFAGETLAEFEQSLAFVETIGFAKVHVFPYSVRSGTRAATMPDQVPQSEKERRSAVMNSTCNRVRQAFLQTQVGTTQQVLFETRDKQGRYEGYTPNYTPVKVVCAHDLSSTIKRVTITSVEDDAVLGELVEDESTIVSSQV